MSYSKEIVDAMLKEDLFTAKKLINEALIAKLGNALEEKLVDFAPTVFNEGSKPDFLDLDKDGNKKEPMKKAARQAKANEDIDNEEETITEEVDEEMDAIFEEFEAELTSLVEEIEEETGSELTEEEISEVANQLLNMISEDDSQEETDEEENEQPENENKETDEDEGEVKGPVRGGVEY